MGGGPAGAAAAITVRQRADVGVLLLEAGDYRAERVGESVPPDVCQPLHRLGAWDEFRRAGHDPCPGSASCWGSGRPGYNDFILNPYGHAWHLDRRRFDRMLAERARALGVRVCPRTRFTAARQVPGGVELTLRDAGGGTRTVHAGRVVDATGAAARLARALGARRRVDDRLFAAVRFAVAEGSEPPAQTLLEAVPEGWWYAARLPDRRVVTMLVAERRTLARLWKQGARGWNDALAATSFVGPRLHGCGLRDESFLLRPAVSCMLDRTEGERWTAVGDAAAAYDPVSAQGIYRAIEDGIEAGEHLAALLTGGAEPPGSPHDARVARYREYLANRAYLYGLERRWPDAPFWRARSASPLVSTASGNP